jgi:hypothetical protein
MLLTVCGLRLVTAPIKQRALLQQMGLRHATRSWLFKLYLVYAGCLPAGVLLIIIGACCACACA